MAADFDDLLELEYEGIRLPCSEHPYSGGHDHAEHRAYLRPGAAFEPTGREPYTGSCTCPLYNTPELQQAYGQLFPLLCERIRGRFEEVPIGRLIHPVLGALRVMIQKWEFKGSSDARNGQELTFRWAEHNASVAEVIDLTRGSPERVESQAAAADEAVAAVAPAAPATAPTVSAGLATVRSGYARPTEVQSAFRDMLAAVAMRLAQVDAGITPGRHLRTWKQAPCVRPFGCDVSSPCLASLGSNNAEATLREHLGAGRFRLDVLPTVGDHDDAPEAA